MQISLSWPNEKRLINFSKSCDGEMQISLSWPFNNNFQNMQVSKGNIVPLAHTISYQVRLADGFEKLFLTTYRVPSSLMTYQHDVISHYLYAKEVIGSQNHPFFPQKKIRKKIYSRSNLKIAGFNTVMSYEVLQHILRLKDSPSIIVVVYSTRVGYFYLRFHAKNNHLDSNVTQEFE